MILVKVVLSVDIILVATGIIKKFQSAASLIGAMLLTGSLAMGMDLIRGQGRSCGHDRFCKGGTFRVKT